MPSNIDNNYDMDDDYDYNYEQNAPYLKFYDPKAPSPQHETTQSSKYFKPIQDPIEELITNSTKGYYEQPSSRKNYGEVNGVQPFDLGNLISRIQQDYVENVRPYVSSIQFVESNPNVISLGFVSQPDNRKSFLYF